jgi:hypothetical protein
MHDIAAVFDKEIVDHVEDAADKRAEYTCEFGNFTAANVVIHI